MTRFTSAPQCRIESTSVASERKAPSAMPSSGFERSPSTGTILACSSSCSSSSSSVSVLFCFFRSGVPSAPSAALLGLFGISGEGGRTCLARLWRTGSSSLYPRSVSVSLARPSARLSARTRQNTVTSLPVNISARICAPK